MDCDVKGLTQETSPLVTQKFFLQYAKFKLDKSDGIC